MDTQIRRFRRALLIAMSVLYLLSLSAFTYANWRVDPEPRLRNALLNAPLLSIPLVLFYGSIYVLLTGWYEHRHTGETSPRLARIIRWAPRVAAILIIFFIALFSLDVFEMEASPLELLAGFLIHSLPSIFMAVLLVVAWRRPLVGFVAFLLAGLAFLSLVITGESLALFLLFSGPLLLISSLFYADWRWNQGTRDPVPGEAHAP